MKVTVKTETAMDSLFFSKEIPLNEADLKDKTLFLCLSNGRRWLA